MAISPPPADRATLGAYGTHAIAVDPKGAFWWESLDGGASWRDRGHLPATVCTPTSTTSSDCLVKVACFESGCVFGDSLTRLGWTSAQPELASARRTAAAEEPTQESFATPLACSVDSKAWQRLPLVEKVPTADQAALGGFAWFAMGENPVDSEVVLWRAKGNAETVERRELLKPANDPVKFAYFRSLQVEGAAAIRFQVPAKIGQEMGPLEVAWEDLIHGASVHQVLSVAGGYQAADSEGEGNVAQRAKPALLSITEGGLYLRAHGETNKEQETFFLDGRTATSLPRVIWPADLQPEHDDWLRVGQQNFPVLFLGSTALVRANRSGPNWAFSAQSIGWLEPERFGLRQAMDLTYVQGHPALHVEWFDTSTHESWASLMPFSQSAPLFAAALSAPTQTDLSPVPAPCSAADLQSTARIVAAPQWGTRHPIQVIEGSALHVLLTQNAVIHGSKEKPCVAAFDAITTGQDSASVDGAVQAIVSPGDLQHAWLFRRMLDAPLARPYVEYRTMSCRFDASLNVPLTPSEPSN
ncbi:MAG TPA: hypothetical protein VL137_04325, partial [Polyangiaceae bacterium]|nr:hypothetical protein [Polyangiaceae bacterium]